jgi:hypothetical protein
VNCDLLVGLPDLHVVDVARVQVGRGEGLVVTVESTQRVMGCPGSLARIPPCWSGVRSTIPVLGTTWRTVWCSIRPLLERAAAEESGFAGVAVLGVDEHVVRHEALLFRMEVGDLHRFAVAAAG